ncbi:DUF3604 domain-containing protein [Candidatus Poribacteria bacterium]
MCIELFATVLLCIPSVISDEIQITDAGYSYSPSVACAPDGAIWSAWKSFDPDSGKTSILLSPYKDNTLADEILVSVAAGDVLTPHIAFSHSGGLWVVWAELRDGKWDIYARSLSGEQLSAESRVTDDGKSFNLAIAADSAGSLWVVWQSRRDGNLKVFARRHLAGEWSEEICISENQSSNRKPAIAIDEKDRAWVAWDTFRNGNYDIYMRHSSESADSWSEPIRVTTAMRYDMTPSLAVDSEGGIWVAWVRSPVWGKEHYRLNVGKRIMLRRYDPETGAFIQPQADGRDLDGTVTIPVEARERVVPLTPRVVIDKNDAIHVLYRQFRNEGPNDWGWNVEMITYSGNEWSDVQVISSEPGFPISEIGAALDETESLWVAYQACGNPGGRKPLNDAASNIYLRSIPIGEFEKPILAGSVMPDSKHVEEFDVARRSPTERESVEMDGKEYQLLWGDLHRHSTLSKCVPERDGTLWDHYRWAQDVAELDFYSTTDHTEQTSDFEARKGRVWCDLFHSEPDFVSIYGYEQNFRDAEHTNFFYMDRLIGEFVREVRLKNTTLTSAIEMLDAENMHGRVLIARHFHGDGFGNKYETAPPINPDYEWVIEAVQTRGFSPVTVAHYLSSGAKVGLVGSSDHSRWPGGRGGPWVYPYALTGLWAENASREAIFDALMKRRCYATNGKKIHIEFSADGHFMGEEYETDQAPMLTIRAVGTTILYKIELIRNGEVVLSENGADRTMEIRYQDKNTQSGHHYYHVRVIQEREGEDNYRGVAMTSPIWITVE